MAELSADDVLRIVRHFLLSAPPGEFEDVLSGTVLLYSLRPLRSCLLGLPLIGTGSFFYKKFAHKLCNVIVSLTLVLFIFMQHMRHLTRHSSIHKMIYICDKQKI